MVRLSDIYHAISNCDQYPIPFPDAVGRRTPEGKIMMETLDAVMASVEQCPVYTGAGIIDTCIEALNTHKENNNDQD